jgi:hypothetical protein
MSCKLNREKNLKKVQSAVRMFYAKSPSGFSQATLTATSFRQCLPLNHHRKGMILAQTAKCERRSLPIMPTFSLALLEAQKSLSVR